MFEVTNKLIALYIVNILSHMYHHQQNKWYPPKVPANFLAHNNLWLCYNMQANSLRLKSSVASKWVSKHLWGVSFILLLMVLVIAVKLLIAALVTKLPKYKNHILNETL